MAVELPGGIKGLNPSPTDAWSGPYSSVNDANFAINPLVRYKTMIVIIMSDLYWYRDGILDTNLVLFNGEDCGTYLTTVPNLTLAPLRGQTVSTNIGSGLAYTAGSSIAVTCQGTPTLIYYVDVKSTSIITFGQQATVDVFMIGGGGGGGSSGGGGGGAGAYYYTNGSPINILSGTVLNITIGAGGAGGTSGNGGKGVDSYIANSTTPTVDILRVKGGGGGGRGGGGNGANGGCGGGGGGGDGFGGGTGGLIGNGTGIMYPGGNGSSHTVTGKRLGGGGGGSGGAGVGAGGNVVGNGGTPVSLTIINNTPMSFGSGGKGASASIGTANTGSGGGGGVVTGAGTGGVGGSGRVILKVITPANTNPITITSGAAIVNNYPDNAKFEGIVSSYNRATGLIEITNIQNITGTFAGSTAYTFNVNTFNGGNAGTNIEIKDSKVNLLINSDIQMNGKAIDTSNSNLWLKVPTTSLTQTSGNYTSKYISITINGTPYKIQLFQP